MRDFFVSYNRADQTWAEWMAWQLEEEGYTTVLQAWDFDAGGNFVLDMQKAASEAERTIAVLSPDYLKSEFTQPEWAAAFAQDPTGRERKFVPVRVHECELTGMWATIVYIDLVDLDGEDAKERLLASLREGRKKPTLVPKFPGAQHHTVTKPDVFPGNIVERPLELNMSIQRVGGNLQTSLALPEMGLNAGPFPFTSPIEVKALDELRWYLENYWKWPVGPDVKRADRLEGRLKEWGDALFNAVFDNPDDTEHKAAGLWKGFQSAKDRARLLTLDATDPDVLRLPWELLSKPKDGPLFSLGISLQRRVEAESASEAMTFELPVRILMVVARPEDESTPFIDPRASSRAVLDAVKDLGTENAVVEFLHPPTLTALSERLHSQRLPRIHVVHFDGHGIYRIDKGLGYLAFEDEKGKLDEDVDAEKIGVLLAGANIPLIVLDACQSAHADATDPFTSLAPRLIQSGVGSVVAMQYSVLVETTRRFFTAFYRALADGRTIGQAMDEGRRVLFADKKRHTLYRPGEGEVDLRLHDWFLPALYQQTGDPAPFADAEIQPTTGSTESRLHGDFPETQYPFTGRAHELWKLDRLLRDRRTVVLHGFGGQGKTALGCEAARWLTHARRFDRALFLSFEGGGAADSATTQMGGMLDDDFSSISQADQLPTLKGYLAEASTLIVWDNFESVLPGWNAELPEDDLQELLELGVTLTADTQTRLLITTREAKLPHSAYTPSQRTAHLPLGGLSAGEALTFASEVLDTLGTERPPERPALVRLLDYLGHHPLSIQLVLLHLPDFNNDVEAVIVHFDELYPGFTEGAAKARNESLAVSLSFSLSRMSEPIRERLGALGVFEGGAWKPNIPPITGLSEDEWDEAARELLRAGLMREERLPGIGVPFYHFHPTLCPHLRSQLRDEQREALEERYRLHYYEVSRYYYHEDSRNPHQIRAIVQRELPNLRHALDLTLTAGEVETAVAFAECIEHFLNVFGRWRERAALMAKIEALSISTEGVLTKTEFLQKSRRGELLLDAGRAREAETVFRELLGRMDARMAYSGLEADYDQAQTLKRLGHSLKAQGRPRDAETEHRHALDVLSRFDAEEAAHRQTGFYYADLADVLRDQGRYTEARDYYERSLQIAEETDNERSAAVALGQLGTLALMEETYAEARSRYHEALDRLRAIGEIRSEAIIWHQLGMVAQKQAFSTSDAERGALLSEAEEACRESLRLNEAVGDKAHAAGNANQLATVAQHVGRPADAERWFRRAIEDFEATGQQRELTAGANNLANLLLNVHRTPAGDRPSEFAGRDLLAEAETWVQKAREIREDINDPSSAIWTTYSTLARIAEARGDGESAGAWWRKERVAFVAFPGNWAQIAPQMEPVVQAVAGAAQGDADVGEAVVQLLDGLAQNEDGRNLAASLRRVVAGDRDVEALADAHNLNGPTYLILTKVLEALAGEASAPDAGAVMAELQRWLASPDGLAALEELQVQNLSQEELMQALLQRFQASS